MKTASPVTQPSLVATYVATPSGALVRLLKKVISPSSCLQFYICICVGVCTCACRHAAISLHSSVHSAICWDSVTCHFSSVQLLNHVWFFAIPWTAACQASLSTPRAYSNSCPLSWWCHPTFSSSVIPFSSCLQSFPASGPLSMSQFFASAGQRIGVSASASVLPMNIQNWFPLGLTGLISLKSKGLSRVFSNNIVQKHRSSALGLLYSPTLTSIHDYWKNLALTRWTFVGKVIFCLGWS